MLVRKTIAAALAVAAIGAIGVPAASAAAAHRPKCRAHHVAKRVRVHARQHGRPVWVRRWKCVKVIAARATIAAPSIAAPSIAAATPALIAGAPATGLTPAPAYTLPALPTSGAPPSILGVGNVPGCLYGADPVPTLAEHPGANAMRVIISPMYGGPGTSGEAAPCLAAAVSAGYRIELVIQWQGGWSDDQIANFFATELNYYARYAWAVAIGNEPELPWGGPQDTPAGYARHWRLASPLVRQAAPDALLVAGEISPWGMGFLRQAYLAGMPGVQVIAAHAYQVQNVFSIPAMEAWCAQIGVPLWDTEGMAGPGEWGPGYELTAGQLLGVQAGFVWLG